MDLEDHLVSVHKEDHLDGVRANFYNNNYRF